MITVGQLVKRQAITLPHSARIAEAAKLMSKQRVGLVVLTDPDEKSQVIGVVSERDIIRGLAKGLTPKSPVSKIATRTVVTIASDSDVGKAARLLTEKGIRHLVVLDDRQRLSGVISVRDLVAERETLKAIVASYETEPVTGVD